MFKVSKNFRQAFLSFVSAATAVAVIAGCSPAKTNDAQPAKTELTISAAASLTDALTEVKASFEAEFPEVSLAFNYGGSGKLATQIEQGTPVDVFISASKKDMDRLEEKELILKDTRRTIASNEVVLIAPTATALQLTNFDTIKPEMVKQISIGNPETVPAGRYAQEIFEKLGLWEKVKDKLVLANDVRQVLTYVETGNVDLGVVYATDAKTSDKIKVLGTAKTEWHKPIVYPAAVVVQSKHPKEAKTFAEYLTSDKAKEILEKYGFLTNTK